MEENCSQHIIINEVREFAGEEIRPFASEFEARGGVPRELIGKMAHRGYLTANLPEKYGGLALDPVFFGLFTEEIGKACASTRSILTVHASIVGETLLRWGTDRQKDYWLPRMAKGKRLRHLLYLSPMSVPMQKAFRPIISREAMDTS